MSLARVARQLPNLGRQAVKTSQFNFARYSSSNTMPLIFVSPGNEWYNNVEVEQVDVQGADSAMGILPAHVPTLAVLKPGKLIVKEEGGAQKSFFVSSGTLTVNEDKTVQIIAEEAVPLEGLDISAIKAAMDKTNAQMGSEQDPVKKAELQIQVECFAAMAAVA